MFFEDLDFTVEKIALVHRYEYPLEYKFTGYSKGRGISGLVYCFSGFAEYKFENNTVCIKQGDILFISENSKYTISTNSKTPFNHITVNFKIPQEELNRLFKKEFSKIAESLVISNIPDIETKLCELLQVWNLRATGYKIKAKALLYNILFRYFSQFSESEVGGKDYKKLMNAKRILDENYCENISVDYLSRICGYSETHFRRIFKSTFGCSPTEYRIKKRLKTAKELLFANELKIAEIAEETGFKDANYFSRIFKEYVGVTPSDYIKKKK